MHRVSASIFESLRSLPIPNRYVVAYSGGCDSHVMLHALVEMRGRLIELKKENADLTSLDIVAIHINHGLQADADQWARHCKAVCAELKIELRIIELKLSVPKGDSLEAYARAARYHALRQKLGDGDMLLLAQHQDDQAETVLLQSLRGSGVKGLAAMPTIIQQGETWQVRPMLSLSRNAINDYAQLHALNWVDDPSNSELRFDRNFLRHQVVPNLKERWPSMAQTLSRVAAHQADADQLITELAQLDWPRCELDDLYSLNLAGLTGLSLARQRNLLRYWIVQRCQFPVPDAATCQRILDQVVAAAVDAEPELHWANVVVRRYRKALYIENQQGVDVRWQAKWNLDTPLSLPCGRQLHARATQGKGVAYDNNTDTLSVRYRTGGEKCILPGRDHHHELKKLFQKWMIPPWQRDRIPLIYVGERIAQVVGYSLCEPFLVRPGQTGYDIYLNDETAQSVT